VNIRLLFALFITFFHQQAQAQPALTFEVRSRHTGDPLSNASIQLLDARDRSVLHFGFTDKNGEKAFANPKRDTVLAKISYLGFLPQERLVFANGQKHAFSLEADRVNLEEVVIREYPKSFSVREDTISYKLKNTVDGTERNLGEALNKLPGLHVDEKGIVHHQGKKIDKILVDGNDFFGNKHQMSTQNLKPRMIDDVELISNYTDNPLEGRGGKTVLNLRMNAGYKNRFIGDVSLDYGALGKYNGHSNTFRFVNQGNLSIIADGNNVGISPLTIEDYMEMRGGISSFIGTLSAGTTTLDAKQFPRFIFNDENFEDKTNGFLALNYTRNNDKWKLNGYSYLYHSKQAERRFRHRTMLNENNLSFTENLIDNSDALFHSSYLNVRYVPTAKSYWNLQVNTNPNRDGSDERLDMAQGNTSSSYATGRSGNNFNAGYSLTYQNKLGDDLLLSSGLSQNYEDSRKKLDVSSDVPFLFLPSGHAAVQDHRLKAHTLTFDTKVQYQPNRDRYALSLGYSGADQALNTRISGLPGLDNDFSLANKLLNASFTTKNHITPKLSFGTTNKLNIYRNDLGQRNNWVRYEPSANVDYQFSVGQKASLSAKLSNEPIDIAQLAPNPIVLDYRTVSRSGIEAYDRLTESRLLTLNYRHFDPQKEMMFNSEIGYSHKKNSIVQSNDFSNGYVANVYVFSPFEDGYSGRIVLHRRFRKVPFTAKNSFTISHTNSMNYVGSNESILTNNTLVYRLSLQSHFRNSAFQIEGGGQFNRIAQEQRYNGTASKVTNYNIFTKFRGLIGERFIWDVKFTGVLQESPLGENRLFFVSPKLTLDSRNRRWTYSLYGSNIFNLRNNTKLVSRFTNISINNTQTAMLDGYILFGLKHNF